MSFGASQSVISLSHIYHFPTGDSTCYVLYSEAHPHAPCMLPWHDMRAPSCARPILLGRGRCTTYTRFMRAPDTAVQLCSPDTSSSSHANSRRGRGRNPHTGHVRNSVYMEGRALSSHCAHSHWVFLDIISLIGHDRPPRPIRPRFFAQHGVYTSRGIPRAH